MASECKSKLYHVEEQVLISILYEIQPNRLRTREIIQTPVWDECSLTALYNRTDGMKHLAFHTKFSISYCPPSNGSLYMKINRSAVKGWISANTRVGRTISAVLQQPRKHLKLRKTFGFIRQNANRATPLRSHHSAHSSAGTHRNLPNVDQANIAITTIRRMMKLTVPEPASSTSLHTSIATVRGRTQ